jgi:hypothetical protein
MQTTKAKHPPTVPADPHLISPHAPRRRRKEGRKEGYECGGDFMLNIGFCAEVSDHNSILSCVLLPRGTDKSHYVMSCYVMLS